MEMYLLKISAPKEEDEAKEILTKIDKAQLYIQNKHWIRKKDI